jgi:hypothetical protein
MNPQHQEDELQRREDELKQREMEIRLRELEMEIEKLHGGKPNSGTEEKPLHKTRKHQEPQKLWQRRMRKLIYTLQFVGLMIAAVVAVRIVGWIAMVVMAGLVAWLIYVLFWKDED